MFDFSESFQEMDRSRYLYLFICAVLSWILLVRVHKYVKPCAQSSKKDHEVELETASPIVSPRSSIVRETASLSNARYVFIDLVRGLAISFVVVFHLVWNLRHNDILPDEPRIRGHVLFVEMCEFWVFFGASFLVLAELFAISMFAGYAGFTAVTFFCIVWHYWASQGCGVGMIMFCVGISSYVQNFSSIQYAKILSRLKKLIFVSACISLATYIVLPDEFVYFGAIHCITAVSIFHLPFLKFPQFALLGVIFVFGYKALVGDFLLEVPVFRDTVDHMPWFENLGYLLFGIFSGYKLKIHHSLLYARFLSSRTGIALADTVFPFLGRHSLAIFIGHQIFLFPVVQLVAKIFP